MWGAHGHPISPPDICRQCSPGRTGCPLLAQSRHPKVAHPCPLLGVKRTSPEHTLMSAYDPKRTWGRPLPNLV
jgi:hypothetical protein